MTVTIVDYGVGNLGSIQNMLKKLGAKSEVASDIRTIERATKIILPGVGSFDTGMAQLNRSGLRPAIEVAVLNKKVPVLGICLGMQLMTEGSEEGILSGLGWIPAKTIRFRPAPNQIMKIPHMGWNIIKKEKNSLLTNSLDDECRFYFLHSYYVNCINRNDALLTTEYCSVRFDSAFEFKNIYGVQFHPEKSHRFGMALMKNFINL